MPSRKKNPYRLTYRTRSRRQKGVAALEFALVFPVIFLLVYGLITYGLILVVQQSLTLAVGEGARAALRYSTNPVTAACQAIDTSSAWLGANISGCATSLPVAATCPYTAASKCLTVTATYPYATKPLVPTLPFLGLVLPTRLKATAVVQLSLTLPTS